MTLIPKEDQKHKLAFLMVVLSFFVTLAWLTIWLFLTPFGLEVPDFSASEATIYNAPFLGILFAEKWVENKNVNKQ
jgi:hypothetical protein